MLLTQRSQKGPVTRNSLNLEQCTIKLSSNLINYQIIERNADVLLNACKHIDLAVNTGKTKYNVVGEN